MLNPVKPAAQILKEVQDNWKADQRPPVKHDDEVWDRVNVYISHLLLATKPNSVLNQDQAYVVVEAVLLNCASRPEEDKHTGPCTPMETLQLATFINSCQ